jgi:hypothetical protein
MLSWLIRSYLLNRLFRGFSRRLPPPQGYGRPPRRALPPGAGYGRPRRTGGPVYGGPRPVRRGRGGFWGPVPYYSTQTRGGTRVSVGGCCLPIPLGLVASATALLVRRVRGRRP